MSKYVYRVAMTYLSPTLKREYTMLIQMPAKDATEALEKAKERYLTWQRDASQFKVVRRWDYETHKTLNMLCGATDLMLWNTDCVPSNKRNP